MKPNDNRETEKLADMNTAFSQFELRFLAYAREFH